MDPLSKDLKNTAAEDLSRMRQSDEVDLISEMNFLFMTTPRRDIGVPVLWVACLNTYRNYVVKTTEAFPGDKPSLVEEFLTCVAGHVLMFEVITQLIPNVCLIQ